MNLETVKARLKSVLHFRYDDSPMSDRVYESHVKWLSVLSRVYHRVEHHGFAEEAIAIARKEHVLLISNHAILLEAALMNYYLLVQKAGKVATLVYREAFKIPLIREFFRSCQCVPISVENGARWLKKRHVLLFPEGMDFIGGFVNPDRVPAFHKGFLRMARQHLKETGKKHLTIIPVGHAGLESAFKFWVIRNKFVLDKLIRPFADYPYFVFPKWPLLFPTKVIFYWGLPVRVTLKDLSSEKKISKKTNEFRAALLHQKMRAQQERETARI